MLKVPEVSTAAAAFCGLLVVSFLAALGLPVTEEDLSTEEVMAEGLEEEEGLLVSLLRVVELVGAEPKVL